MLRRPLHVGRIGTSETPRYLIQSSDGRERDVRIWATPDDAEQAMARALRDLHRRDVQASVATPR